MPKSAPIPGTDLYEARVEYGSLSSTLTHLSRFILMVLQRIHGPLLRIRIGPTRSSKNLSSANGMGHSTTTLGLNCSVETKKLGNPSGCLSFTFFSRSSTEDLLITWNAASVQKVFLRSSWRLNIRRFGLSSVLRRRGDLIAKTSLSIAAENHYATLSLNW